jgi:tetratricopeptide (TPR) repeat protein
VLCRILPALLAFAAALSPSTLYGQQRTVLINAFDNATGDRNLDWLREAVVTTISDRLLVEPALYVFGFDERVAAYERFDIPETVSLSRATAMRIGWDIGADFLVSGRISGTPDAFRIEARIVDLAENSAGSEVVVNGKLADTILLASTLASRLAVVLVPGSTVAAGNGAPSSIPPKAFEAYVRGILNTDPQRRTELLQEAIRLHPNYWAAIYQLGQMHYLDSNYTDSTELLQKIPAGSPEYATAQYLLGMNAYHQADYPRAVRVYSALAPGYDALVNLGAALARTGDNRGAGAAWERALERNPAGPEAAFNLAFLSFSSSDWQGAAGRLAELLKAYPRDAEAMFLLGQTYDRLGRAVEAQQLTAQALRLSPRLSRWVGQPAPAAIRVRTEFDATELRVPAGIWNEARLSRRVAARNASESSSGARE